MSCIVRFSMHSNWLFCFWLFSLSSSMLYNSKCTGKMHSTFVFLAFSQCLQFPQWSYRRTLPPSHHTWPPVVPADKYHVTSAAFGSTVSISSPYVLPNNHPPTGMLYQNDYLDHRQTPSGDRCQLDMWPPGQCVPGEAPLSDTWPVLSAPATQPAEWLSVALQTLGLSYQCTNIWNHKLLKVLCLRVHS